MRSRSPTIHTTPFHDSAGRVPGCSLKHPSASVRAARAGSSTAVQNRTELALRLRPTCVKTRRERRPSWASQSIERRVSPAKLKKPQIPEAPGRARPTDPELQVGATGPEPKHAGRPVGRPSRCDANTLRSQSVRQTIFRSSILRTPSEWSQEFPRDFNTLRIQKPRRLIAQSNPGYPIQRREVREEKRLESRNFKSPSRFSSS